MAKTAKRINRRKLVTVQVYAIISLFILFGMVIGLVIGALTAPTKTVTLTETIEVPSYSSDNLPEVEDIYYYDVPLSHSLQRFIYEVCADENVPVALAMAMIEHESQFNPEIVSSTDDYGLMQINSINHEQLEEKYRTADMLDPYQNVYCGIKIIGSYIEKYTDYGNALMAYNMGEYGAKKAWENGVQSTSYSTTILELMANDLAEWLAEYYSAGIEYEYDTRGNPEIDVTDIVYQENEFYSDMKVNIYRHTINFKQSFSGRVTARRKGG